MFWQREITVPQKFRPVNHGMHQNIMTLAEIFYLIPGKNPICRECRPVIDNFLCVLRHFLIDIIRNHHIHTLPASDQFPQGYKHLFISLLIQPVVAVHHLKIYAGSLAQPGVNRLPMPPVLLVYGFYN